MPLRATKVPQGSVIQPVNVGGSLVPEFSASPTDELHLFLLMKDIRRTLR